MDMFWNLPGRKDWNHPKLVLPTPLSPNAIRHVSGDLHQQDWAAILRAGTSKQRGRGTTLTLPQAVEQTCELGEGLDWMGIPQMHVPRGPKGS